MVVKMFMPVACPDKVNALKRYGAKKHPNMDVEVISLYKKLLPQTLLRQNIVYIANQSPKLITKEDRVYVLVINHPILMGMLCSRITDRMTKLFTRAQRRWFLLEYDPMSKSFIEYFLP